ncbi:tetratricopeptide repeat protein [Flagellimonas halotolerans]|uniref:Tetratricopeptide repeat protein n=1 Tax=Flagellimonas halotolerans TaxID=3112164 RepID=A0ABU6IS37_9FLAO|nr:MULTISPECIES: tetratricopeptide repeat protein [unclassified Allomuricauda]MEC3965819.1 tetratricopeptide repeat protein [Muricauda sp. SYSU M86414]MEC4265715.1 tetratricopeptide repeat protein [Muricauda sp. SYSU M84420]
MRTRILILLAVGISTMGFAQKDAMKTAERALKDGDAAAAKAALTSAASTIDSAKEKDQAEYYALLGNANYELAKKGEVSAFQEAVDAYNKVIAVEEADGRSKYTSVAQEKMGQMTADLVNSAVEDNNNKKFSEAAEKLYMSYKLSPKDTVYLYYAASSAVNGQDYEEALKYYKELKDIGYNGESVTYTAVNIETGETESMDKATRDLYVKAGTHKDPKEEVSPSKKPEIVKNIALIYQQMGENEKAIEAYADARAENPDDVNLVLGEANLYYAIGDKEKFKELMGQASAMAPDNADLLYNIGVINMEQGNLEDARDAYKKALSIDPGYINALLNLSTTYVNEGNGLIDEMNELGTSKADIAKYDELKDKKDSLFREGAAVLEDALQSNPDNESILTQLKNIYGALGDNENFMRIKKLLEE